MRAIMAITTAAVAVALLASGCNSNGEEASGRTTTLGAVSFADHGTKDARGKGSFELEADSFYFSPTFIHASPGERLTLEIENESADKHNFTIAGQVDEDIDPKGKAKVVVTVPASGALVFYCEYHTARGMNGELLAGDADPQPVASGLPKTGS